MSAEVLLLLYPIACSFFPTSQLRQEAVFSESMCHVLHLPLSTLAIADDVVAWRV